MSLKMRESFSSAAMRFSAPLRCCRTCWAFSWSCQKPGLELRVSSSARRLRWRGTSKIAPHKLDAFGEFLKTMFEVFNNHDVSLIRILKILAKITARLQSGYELWGRKKTRGLRLSCRHDAGLR